MTIYVAAALVVAKLVAMASGRVDPLLALLVALILAGILWIAPASQLAAGQRRSQTAPYGTPARDRSRRAASGHELPEKAAALRARGARAEHHEVSAAACRGWSRGERRCHVRASAEHIAGGVEAFDLVACLGESAVDLYAKLFDRHGSGGGAVRRHNRSCDQCRLIASGCRTASNDSGRMGGST